MATIKDALDVINKLSAKDKKTLKSMLLSSSIGASSLDEYVGERRFSGGRKCPRCGETHIVRYGKAHGNKQRYLCKGCHRTFLATTNSIVELSPKNLSVWEKYIECMMEGMSIRKSAAVCGIHRNTAFIWRHKILDALQQMAESVELDGIVEADETFFALSYKGNHKRSKTFAMPRAPHRRGGEVHKRGLSDEQVCVPCAVNRNGLSIAKVTNTGNVSITALHLLYDHRISTDAILVTDKANSYKKFADSNAISLVQVKSKNDVYGRRILPKKNGIYHIQHVNNYHSQLKRFMRQFNGVSTKYLNNYLIWNNLVNYAKETDEEKKNIFLSFVLTAPFREKSADISSRAPIPKVA